MQAKKHSDQAHARPMFCYDTPGISLTVPTSYDAVAFYLGQCEKRQCHVKLATSFMLERGVHVDHSTINRWAIKYSPQLEATFHPHKRPVWVSWRMDET
jgi:transposase-like protein